MVKIKNVIVGELLEQDFNTFRVLAVGDDFVVVETFRDKMILNEVDLLAYQHEFNERFNYAEWEDNEGEVFWFWNDILEEAEQHKLDSMIIGGNHSHRYITEQGRWKCCSTTKPRRLK